MAKKKEEQNGLFSLMRKMDYSDGLMRSINKDGVETPIAVYAHGMRVTKAYEQHEKSKSATSEGDGVANLAFGEVAKLPEDSDTLVLRYNILPQKLCINPSNMTGIFITENIVGKLENVLASDKGQNAIDNIAKAYAYNILSGSALWRNRSIATSITTTVSYDDKEIVVDDSSDMELRPFFNDNGNVSSESPALNNDKVSELATCIATSFKSSKHCVINVEHKATTIPGAEIFPSQLFLDKSMSSYKNAEGKTAPREFYKMPGSKANKDTEVNWGITAEKLGNALRTFDAFHNFENGMMKEMVIPVEPNGGVLTYATAFRNGAKNNYYYFQRMLLNKGEEEFLNTISDGDLIFFIGNIVRGGLFGETEK